MPLELHPHQKKAVNELDNGKILRGDPGVGKSFTALAYFFTKELGGTLNDWGSIKTPKDLYIITTAKKRNERDWQNDAFKLGLMEDPAISLEGIRVTVDSWNNIEKYLEVKDAFFIFDEQKVVGSGVWAKSFVKLAKHNRWILLSATPGDTWLDYAPVFLANGFYKNITEFKHTHVVYATWVKFPKVESYRNVGRLVRNRNAVLVEMPYERHTTRHLFWTEVGHDADDLERVTKRRWHVYEERPLRDVAELFSVARKVVNSDASRLTQLRKIQAKHKRVIVFYNFDYELEILRTLGGPETSRHTHGPIEPLSVLENSTSMTQKTRPSSPTTGSELTHQLTTETSSPTSTTNESPKTRKPSSRSSKKASQSTVSSIFAVPTVLEFDRTNLSDLRLRTGVFPPATPIDNYEIPKPPRRTASVKDSSGGGSIVVAEWNGHKHQPVPTTHEWIYLVQYRAGAEAWNCTTADTVVFYSMTYSYKDFEQSQGRIDRMNTLFNDLNYYIFFADAWIDVAIKKALDNKQDFNEARLRHRVEAAEDLERIVDRMSDIYDDAA